MQVPSGKTAQSVLQYWLGQGPARDFKLERLGRITDIGPQRHIVNVVPDQNGLGISKHGLKLVCLLRIILCRIMYLRFPSR